MKIKEILGDQHESHYNLYSPEKRKEFLEELKKECAPYFMEIGGYDNWKEYALYHGTRMRDNFSYFRTLEINQHRSPTDTPLRLHQMWNNAFNQAGLKAHRGNSIFASGNYNTGASHNAYPVILVPIGNFNFTWNEDVEDLYNVEVYQNLIKNGYLKFTEDGLEKFFQNNHRYIKEKLEAHGVDISTVDEFIKFVMNDKNYIIFQMAPSVKSFEEVGFVDNNLSDYVKKHYKSTGLLEAIRSGVEIMINAPKVYVIHNRFFDDIHGITRD
jgi:hypothetical protein